MKVLVLGAGTTTGLGVLRSLRASALPLHIIGCDYAQDASGFAYCDDTILIESNGTDNFLATLIDDCRSIKPDVIVPASNLATKTCSLHREYIERQCHTLVMCSNAKTYSITEDKWLCYLHLKEHEILQPQTTLCGDWSVVQNFIHQTGFPVIVKPRDGTGSRDIRIFASRDQLISGNNSSLTDETFIIQRLVSQQEHEYSVGLTISEDQKVLSIIALRRFLKNGMTGAACVDQHPGVLHASRKIASTFNARGYLNIQFFLEHDVPIVFDINPRPSTSNYMRTLAGINEAHILMANARSGELPPEVVPLNKYFIRHLDEKEVSEAVWKRIYS